MLYCKNAFLEGFRTTKSQHCDLVLLIPVIVTLEDKSYYQTGIKVPVKSLSTGFPASNIPEPTIKTPKQRQRMLF